MKLLVRIEKLIKKSLVKSGGKMMKKKIKSMR